MLQQICNPFGIFQIGLASGDSFEMLGVHHQHFHVPFEHVKNRLPKAARTFHGNVSYAQVLKPLTHPQQIRHHGAKRALLFVPLPPLIGSNGTHDHISLVDIDPCAPLIHNVHRFPPGELQSFTGG